MSINAESPQTIFEFIEQQSNLKSVKFIACGSVDDGKSTLLGRLLFETQKIFEDQISRLKNNSNNLRGPTKHFDFSLLFDGLSAEKEQGITIDVAYRYFSTDTCRFVVMDTPGHEQ